MKIGIVGGTGNISQPIVRLLLEQGHEVVCFNRRQTDPLLHGVRVIQGDRYQRAEFEQKMQAEKFDAAIDMICFNAEDAASSVRAFRGVGWFVQTSTTCTYGIQYDHFPSDETHPLRPTTEYAHNKVAADEVYLAAFQQEKFPVVIIKPSTTYGPVQGMLRQICWDFSWIDRVKKGKPILVCDDGQALHQHLHVDDIAKAFVGVIGKEHTLGQIYNAVDRDSITWAEYHRLAGKILGREVELVGVPFEDLKCLNVPDSGILEDEFAYDMHYCAEKMFRDVPEFQPQISLEQGMSRVFEVMEREGRIPNSDELKWEDEIIERRKRQRMSEAANQEPGFRMR
ncbi:MAG TPA: NAD-dependent epimerase/dehydratase family protein [Anaerolineales bacterium]|nr:NAD-dependent epimerase/dehydratase family protein [Anaerolineales bacterium]